jgi:endothelin-converting enzyme
MGQWQSQPTCTTPACIQAASHVLSGLAPNWAQMDPCTNFDKSEQPPTSARFLSLG